MDREVTPTAKMTIPDLNVPLTDSPDQTQPPAPRGGLARRGSTLFQLFLLLLILAGVAYRFSRVDWSQGTNLHPDEYGLTGTLTQLRLPTSLAGYFNTRISPLSPYQKYNILGLSVANGPDNRLRWGQWPLILLKAGAELTGNTGYGEQRLLGRQMSALADVISLLFIFLIGARLYNPKVGLLAAALSALAALQIQQSHFMTVDNFAVMFTVLAMYAAVRVAQRPVVVRTSGTGASQFSGEISQPPAPPRNGEGGKRKWGVFAAFRRKNSPNLLVFSPFPSGKGVGGIGPHPKAKYVPDWAALGWYAAFGVLFGMAVASKVNLLPLGGMVGVATLIAMADLKLRTRADFKRILFTTATFLAVAVVTFAFTFRVTQPMAFRALTGDTSLLTLNPNPDWVESMKVAQSESDGIGGGPPGEQWAFRAPVLFPLMNMVLWGMGLPLGLAGWAGWLGALWQWLRRGRAWRANLLPLVWVGGYFFFMATRWVKSVRYFLPVYPFLCLLAAWGLLALWQRSRAGLAASRVRWSWAPGLLIGLVTLGTLAWATVFMSAVYWTDHTRLQATRWIYTHVPGPVQLTLQTEGGPVGTPVGEPENLTLSGGDEPLLTPFTPLVGGTLSGVELPHVRAAGPGGRLNLSLALDREGTQIIDQVDLEIPAPAGTTGTMGVPVRAALQGGLLETGRTYYLRLSVPAGGPLVVVSRSVVTNESWDEGLPVPFEGVDPFGQLYRGLTMEVRWADSEDKRTNLLVNMAQADFIIVPSQRAVWASCRIPRTYPMTMEYYRALFDGRLGFDLAAEFTAPLRLGPLYFSDLGGSVAWGAPPALPVLNHNPLSAEEAFSVYDHPPVWIFQKRADFDLAKAQSILTAIDLNQVVVQGPKDADGPPCP